ncbi:MAG TPA: ferrochelatase, partial [Alphaproteobacteria bacterium]|nr:ferrochelatase [Alphaproteobacteria bacterium]
ITRLQAEHLAKTFKQDGLVVDYAMRYGEPSIPNQLQKLTDQGCTQIVVMPLYPQYAASTTATVNDELFKWMLDLRWQPAIRTVPPWHDNPTYISALANSVRAAVAENGKPDALVISFHGIPKRYHMSGDPYHCHCMKTARLLREELGWDTETFHATFQSRFGSEPWLMPYTDEAVTEMAEHGHKHVMVLAPGFVADCLETLDELGNELEEEFHEAGGETLTYIPCLNDSDDGMKVIEELAAANLAGWVDVAPRPAAKAPKPKAVRMKKAG